MVPLPATAGHPVSAVAVSADRVAALCDGTVYRGSLAGGLSALCEGAVDVAVHGSRVYTGRDNAVVVVDADSGRELARIGPTESPLQGFAVDGRHVALGEYREVSIWDGERCVARRRLHDGTVPHLAFAPTGGELVTRRNDEFAIWPWRSRWARVRRAQAGEGYGSGFAFLPDGRMIGALGRDRLGIWSARGSARTRCRPTTGCGPCARRPTAGASRHG